MRTVNQVVLLVSVLVTLPALTRFKEIREGRQLDNVFNFIQEMFSSNISHHMMETEQEELPAQIEEEQPKAFNHSVFLPESANEASIILKNRFTELLRDIPADIDTAIAAITEQQAKSNMLDYTVAAAFLLAAIVDSAADFVLEERNFTDILASPQYAYINTYLYGYGIGFGAPFWIGLENPRQDCGGRDYVGLIEDLDLNLDRLSQLSSSQRYILTRRLRFQKEKRLFCLTSKIDRYKEAGFANSKIDEIVSIISVYSSLRLTAESPIPETFPIEPERIEEISKSIDELDDELQLIFDNFERQIVEAYDYAYSSRTSENLIKIVIGIPNLLGMIGGLFMLAERVDFEELPALEDVPATLIQNFNNLTTAGRASNDFLVGDGLAIFGMQCWGYGYYAPYFTRLIDPDPGCGIHDFNDVVRQFREFSNLRAFYGSPQQILTGGVRLNVENLPEYVKYRMERFGRELRVALHCLISRVDKTSYNLLFSIEQWLDLATYRMDLTAELMNIFI